MKHDYQTWLCVLLLCGVIGHVASATISDAQPLMVQGSRTAHSPEQTSVSQAGQWGLSTAAMQRYRELMAGPRGMQSPGLDPLSTLGIEADTDVERRQYAELWVKAEFARTEKELRFQREINAAWQRLYPQVLPVALGHTALTGDVPGGRLALFVRRQKCVSCDERLSAILAGRRPVDIYLVDSQGDDRVLRQWARDHRIPVDRVRRHDVTLNHDGGLWMRVANGQMPVVLEQGSNGWHIVTF